MKQGMETPEAMEKFNAAEARVRAWCKKVGLEDSYSEYSASCTAVGGFGIVLVIDKIIERMAWA